MNQIIVPIDFSDTSFYAVKVAQQIAEKKGVEVHLVHVIEPIHSYVAIGDGMYVDSSAEQRYLDTLEEQAKNKLGEFIQKQTNTITFSIEIGSYMDKIKEYAKKETSELLVIGTEGAEGLEDVFVGSNTERVIRVSPIPVLAVKMTQEPFEIRNIVFASNLAEAQIEVLQNIKKLQELFDAELHIFFVNTPADFYNTSKFNERKNVFIEKLNLEKTSFTLYCDLTEEQGILAFAKEKKADIIAMTTHQRRGLSHLLSGSIAEDIVNHAEQAVLTYGLRYKKA